MAQGLRQALRSPSNRLWFYAGLHAARDGFGPQAIAERLGEGVTAANIEAMFVEAGYVPRPLPKVMVRLDVIMSGKHRSKIDTEAQRRGTEMPELVSALLAKVAQDDLFAAILD